MSNNTEDLLDIDLTIDTVDDSLVLTTIDNPFNPKTDYINWKRFDSDNEYNTEEYIARLISMEGVIEVDDAFQLKMLTSKVVDDILANDDEKLYRLV